MKYNASSVDKALKGITSGWVSLSEDYKKVIAHAKTLEELVNKLKKKGNPEGIVTRVTTPFSNYIG